MSIQMVSRCLSYGEICRGNQRFKCKVFGHPITIWIWYVCPPKWIHQILHQCSRDFNIWNVAGRDHPDSKLVSNSTQKKTHISRISRMI
jgi:hypothetical protein